MSWDAWPFSFIPGAGWRMRVLKNGARIYERVDFAASAARGRERSILLSDPQPTEPVERVVAAWVRLWQRGKHVPA